MSFCLPLSDAQSLPHLDVIIYFTELIKENHGSLRNREERMRGSNDTGENVLDQLLGYLVPSSVSSRNQFHQDT